jgi:hypothetical protein
VVAFTEILSMEPLVEAVGETTIQDVLEEEADLPFR